LEIAHLRHGSSLHESCANRALSRQRRAPLEMPGLASIVVVSWKRSSDPLPERAGQSGCPSDAMAVTDGVLCAADECVPDEVAAFERDRKRIPAEGSRLRARALRVNVQVRLAG